MKPLPNMTLPVSEIRCDCGKLLARRTAAGIELKCRRCGRRLEVSPEDLSSEPRELELTFDVPGGRLTPRAC